jgi:type VI secretion system secreted protein VgrG
MKKLLLLSIFCIMLIAIAYSQMQLAMEKKLRLEAYDEIMISTGKASITMKKNGNIVISGSSIQIEGSDDINVKASNKVILKGNKIKDN